MLFKSIKSFFDTNPQYHPLSPDLEYVLESLRTEGKRVTGAKKEYIIERNGKEFKRYICLIEGVKHGLDFNMRNEFLGISKLGSFHLTEAHVPYSKMRGRVRLWEAGIGELAQRAKTAVGNIGKNKEKQGAKTSTSKVPEQEPQEHVKNLKTDAFSKDILSGSDIFKDMQRKLRLFLRGRGKQNIFCIGGAAGLGKSYSAKESLNKECGPEIQPDELQSMLKEISFDAEDFGVRFKAHSAIEQAKSLYARYLHNFEANASNQPEPEPKKEEPVAEPASAEIGKAEEARKKKPTVKKGKEDIKKKALKAVQDKLEPELFGYVLTLGDVEGTAEKKMAATDPIMKLKELGNVKAKIPYSPSNRWVEGPSQMSNKDLYLQLYQANARILMIDEGDYFLVKDNPLMKVATNNTPFRRISSGTNQGYFEVGSVIIPESYWYTGKMVITTNRPESEWNEAIRSRCDKYILHLSLNQLFSRLKDILPEIHKNDLSHIPFSILVKIKQLLQKYGKEGELKTFDYRMFILLADEFALMLDDSIHEAREENPQIPTLNIYKTNQDQLKVWTETPEGQAILRKASAKFRKVLLNGIQQMNRQKPSDENSGVFEIENEEEAA